MATRRSFGACRALLACAIASALLVGCGGGGSGGAPGAGVGGGSSSGTNTNSVIKVTPSLGQFGTGATVRIGRLDGSAVAAGTVGTDGVANLSIDTASAGPGPFLIEAGKDGDVFFDERVRTFVPIRLPAGKFALRGATSELTSSMGLSPFSEFAVGLLEAQPGGLGAATAADVRAANVTVEQLYGLHKGPLKAATNEPPSLGVLSIPAVFDSASRMFEPPLGTPNQTICETLPSGLQACYNPGAPFSGALTRDQAYALIAAAISYMAAPGSDVVQLVHELRDDLKDGVFDLRRNGVLLVSLSSTFNAQIGVELTNARVAYLLDANGILRSATNGSISTDPVALTSYRREFLTAYRTVLTALGLQVLRDYKGSSLNYVGFQDFTLDRNAIQSMTLFSMVRTLQSIADQFRSRIPRRTIENGLASTLERYNIAGLDASMAAMAANALTTSYTNYLSGPAPCDAGFVRNVSGVCVPGSTGTGGSTGGTGGASPSCSAVVGQVISVNGFSSIPQDCVNSFYFTWSTDSQGPGTGTFEGSCRKAMNLWGVSNVRTACYCYVAAGTTSGSAVSDGERVCYVGF